jgi:hypothetical protein
MCQLAFGNTRAAYLNLRKDQVRWVPEPPGRSEGEVRSAQARRPPNEPAYFASSKIARRGFCPNCGTPLTFEFHGSESMDLSVGSLDDPSAFKPTEHWSIESRIAGWHTEDGLPGHRLDANERINQRWRDAYGDAAPGLETARSG